MFSIDMKRSESWHFLTTPTLLGLGELLRRVLLKGELFDQVPPRQGKAVENQNTIISGEK
jgi:hypothetical protein